VDARRSQRVCEALREELTEIVSYELEDPRLATVAVTAVEVSADLSSAEVRVRCEDAPREAEALKALEHARHFIRRELACRIRLWRMPELHFASDRSGRGANRVDQLLERIEKERKKAGKTV
jgi:ribosome-binding factor A